MGVRIETSWLDALNAEQAVTPFVGVWIETLAEFEVITARLSHPSWVCGLKLRPHADAREYKRHTLRGCVD